MSVFDTGVIDLNRSLMDLKRDSMDLSEWKLMECHGNLNEIHEPISFGFCSKSIGIYRYSTRISLISIGVE